MSHLFESFYALFQFHFGWTTKEAALNSLFFCSSVVRCAFSKNDSFIGHHFFLLRHHITFCHTYVLKWSELFAVMYTAYCIIDSFNDPVLCVYVCINYHQSICSMNKRNYAGIIINEKMASIIWNDMSLACCLYVRQNH